jgi:hypothetical protein
LETLTERVESRRGVPRDRAEMHEIRGAGDAAYLAVVQRCIYVRCRLLGLYAQPEQAQQTTVVKLIGVNLDEVWGVGEESPPRLGAEISGLDEYLIQVRVTLRTQGIARIVGNGFT